MRFGPRHLFRLFWVVVFGSLAVILWWYLTPEGR